ncbi:MAG TPA: Rho termination factor N-terminal domain-containing protein [Solirubrobacteraceae bacterium]|jgi:transcription termination factor Rho|nr:Rho termination factor N-terminal domain-containing protein [Solirubrobacteraceae bacterium]
MAVLERSELEASPLADLHAIANEVGLEGFRRLRKADLIDAILGESSPAAEEDGDSRPPQRASSRSRSSAEEPASPRARRRRPSRSRRSREDVAEGAEATERPEPDEPVDGAVAAVAGRIAAGIVEVLGNGSAFLRVDPPEPSDEDVYISAAQVRRCELVSGDRVTGPVRTPRRSERYPSLVRIDTINGASAETVSDGARYDELPVDWPSERLALDSKDPTLEAIEWLTPLGRGSRVLIVGARHAGKTETLRRMLETLHGREDLEVSLVLVGVRPEEIGQWREGPVAPAAALSFAASADSQDQALERVIDAAKRVAARGGDALVVIDNLDGLHPHAARKALAAARNLRDGGSLTVIALAESPLGGETTVIALDAALTSTGRQPILDLINSGTLRPELLVGDDGAQAITKARLAAVEAAG